MTVLTASPKPVTDSKKDSSSGDVHLNVTGVDVKGQMFRHPATVVMLDGRDCVFRSESQPELDGSVLTEFNYEGANPQTRVSQGRVKSTQADPQGGYKVIVELEFAQSKKVISNQTETPPTVQKSVALPVPSVINVTAETKIGPAPTPFPTPAPREFPMPAKINEMAPRQPAAKIEEFLPMQSDNRSSKVKVEPAEMEGMEERIKAAVASEIQREMSLLKNSISSEIEKALPTMVASKMEKMIREDVEKQFHMNYETSLQSLQADVAQKVEGRLAGSPDLQAMLQNTAKRFFEEHAAQFQGVGIKAEEEINSRAASIMRPFEQSLADLEARMNASRTEIILATASMQAMKQEINAEMHLVQEALQQVRDAEKPSIEKMQNQAAAQLREWSTQFDNLLNKSATEKAIQFSLDVERRMAPHRQRADETAEKLGAMLQLLQGTARVQQERLNEHSREAAANLEKQIKAFLVRLGGGA